MFRLCFLPQLLHVLSVHQSAPLLTRSDEHCIHVIWQRRTLVCVIRVVRPLHPVPNLFCNRHKTLLTFVLLLHRQHFHFISTLTHSMLTKCQSYNRIQRLCELRVQTQTVSQLHTAFTLHNCRAIRAPPPSFIYSHHDSHRARLGLTAYIIYKYSMIST